MHSFLRIPVILLCLLLLTGCWDRVEIEERGFVIGVGLDLLKAEDRDDLTEENHFTGDYPIEIIYQFVEPKGLGLPSQDGSGSTKAYLNVTQTGDNASEITHTFAKTTSRTPYFEHLEMIIISEEAAKKEGYFSSLLDFYLRNNEMRRGAKVVIGKNPKELLDIDAASDKIPVLALDSLTENDDKNPSIVQLIRIGDIHEFLLNQQSFMLQYAQVADKKAVLNGAAVFQGHNNKMAGKLTNREVFGANLINSRTKGGIIKVKYKGRIVTFNISRAKSSISGDIKDEDHLSFTIKIKLEGVIDESFWMTDFRKEKISTELENAFEKEVTAIAYETIAKAKELNAEVLGLSDFLKKKNYPLWKKIRTDWDHGENYFAESDINVEAKVIIRSTGTLNKSANR